MMSGDCSIWASSPPQRTKLAARRQSPRRRAAAGVAAGVFGMSAAHAQVAAEPPVRLAPVTVMAPDHRPATSEGSDSYRATSVTVGGKDATPILEIPQSVSVITRRRIEDQNLVTSDDALREVTGVTVTAWDGSSFQIRSRGYLMESTYDGIPSFGGLNALQQYDLAIYDRLEVLRGPAGLFQGSGQPGGVVNFVRKRGMATAGGAAAASVGSWSNHHGELEVGGPLNKEATLRSRFVVAGQDRDYFYDHAHGRRGTVYGTLDYDLTPDTEVSLYTAYQDDRTSPFSGLPAYADGRFLNVPRSTNPYPGWTFYDTTISTVAAELEHRFGNGWKVNTRASRVSYDNGLHDAFPATGINRATGLANYTRRGWEYESTRDAVDVYATGPFALLGRQHGLTVGVNHERYGGDTLYGATTTVAGVSFLNPDTVAKPPMPPYVRGYQDETEQTGLYSQVRLSVTDPLSVMLGARVSNFAQRSRNKAPATPTPWADGARENGQVTPSAGIVYRLADTMTAYASYADIFMPQTARTVQGDTLEPRVGEQVELGVKGSFNDGRLIASAAVFRTRDVNRSFNDPANPGFFLAAGQVEVKGWEAELSGSPMPNLEMTLGYTNMTTRYGAHPTLANTPFSLFEPRHSLKLYGNYRFDGGRWFAGGGLQLTSAVIGSGVPGVREQGGYAVASAQLGYRLDRATTVALAVNNLFDRTYYARVGGLNSYNTYGDPRNVTLSLRTRF
jgi:outer membrane receptor for ferric coprogen and ferric-rhodotorulic acid